MQGINPFTEEKLTFYADHLDQEVLEKVRMAHESFLAWEKLPYVQRAELMRAAAGVLKNRKKALAKLITQEMGKPIGESEAEIDKCVWVCDYYAENAESFLKPELVKTDATKSYISYQPLGIVFAIMPWNYPFWQVFRFAAPTLMAGNVGILKHAPNVPGCANAIEEVFAEAGFPSGVFTNLFISTDQAAQVIEQPQVSAVTLTGSTRAGKAVAKKAGEFLKKTVLELGGSDPYLILEDADLDLAVRSCVASRLLNNGQSCISAKRFIVPRSIRELFVKKLIDLFSTYKSGDPLDQSHQLGTMARKDLRDELHRQVSESVKMGARCERGGYLPDIRGFFYPPTVLTDVRKGMPAYDEELFGPVASVIEVSDEVEAIKVANQSMYGLGAGIFSKDVERARRIAEFEIEAGSCFINDFVRSDPRLPFGGIKQSGYGRELSLFGIREFVNIKTIYIK